MTEESIVLRLTFYASYQERGQVILRHTELTAYRCFLPDLAGFTGFRCTGPSPLSVVLSAEISGLNLRRDISSDHPSLTEPHYMNT